MYSWQLPLCTNRFFSCEIGFLYVNVGSDALGGEVSFLGSERQKPLVKQDSQMVVNQP